MFPDLGAWKDDLDGLRADVRALTTALGEFPRGPAQHSPQLREWERFTLIDGGVTSGSGGVTIGDSQSNLRPAPNGFEAYITSVAVTVGGASAAATVTNYNGPVDPTNLFDFGNGMLGNSPSRLIAFYDHETVYVEQGDAISIVIAGAVASQQVWVRVCGKRRQV